MDWSNRILGERKRCCLLVLFYIMEHPPVKHKKWRVYFHARAHLFCVLYPPALGCCRARACPHCAPVPIVSSSPRLGARPLPAGGWRGRARALRAVAHRHLAAAAGSAPGGCRDGAEPPGCKTEEKGAGSCSSLPGWCCGLGLASQPFFWVVSLKMLWECSCHCMFLFKKGQKGLSIENAVRASSFLPPSLPPMKTELLK